MSSPRRKGPDMNGAFQPAQPSALGHSQSMHNNDQSQMYSFAPTTSATTNVSGSGNDLRHQSNSLSHVAMDPPMGPRNSSPYRMGPPQASPQAHISTGVVGSQTFQNGDLSAGSSVYHPHQTLSVQSPADAPAAAIGSSIPFSDLTLPSNPPQNWPATSTPEKYAWVLEHIDNDFAEYLSSVHGLPQEHPSNIVGASSIIGANNNARTSIRSTGVPLSGYNSPGGAFAASIAARYKVTVIANDPTLDPSIQAVINNFQAYADLLYAAINNTTDIKDRPSSSDVKLVTGGGTTDDLKRATCNLILVALIHRCVVGYCGHGIKCAHSPTDQDKQYTCAERINAVIEVLRDSKAVCRDVIYEESRIALLVHQPRACLGAKKLYRDNNGTKKRNLEETRKRAESVTQRRTLAPTKLDITTPEAPQLNNGLEQDGLYQQLPSMAVAGPLSAPEDSNLSVNANPPSSLGPIERKRKRTTSDASSERISKSPKNNKDMRSPSQNRDERPARLDAAPENPTTPSRKRCNMHGLSQERGNEFQSLATLLSTASPDDLSGGPLSTMTGLNGHANPIHTDPYLKNATYPQATIDFGFATQGSDRPDFRQRAGVGYNSPYPPMFAGADHMHKPPTPAHMVSDIGQQANGVYQHGFTANAFSPGFAAAPIEEYPGFTQQFDQTRGTISALNEGYNTATVDYFNCKQTQPDLLAASPRGFRADEDNRDIFNGQDFSILQGFEEISHPLTRLQPNLPAADMQAQTEIHIDGTDTQLSKLQQAGVDDA